MPEENVYNNFILWPQNFRQVRNNIFLLLVWGPLLVVLRISFGSE